MVNNSELDVAYAVQEVARWQEEVFSRSTLCAWMSEAGVVDDAASCQTKLKPKKAE